MGQEPKKYHISDDGKIYEVKSDGSVNALGHISQLHDGNSEPVDPKPTVIVKHSKLPWIIVIIFAASSLIFGYWAYLFHEDKDGWYHAYMDIQSRYENSMNVEYTNIEEAPAAEDVLEEALVCG